MERLMCLNVVITPAINTQAEEICKLMDEAIQKQQTFIIYSGKKIHPLITHVLTGKGYTVNIISTSYDPVVKYSISIS